MVKRTALVLLNHWVGEYWERLKNEDLCEYVPGMEKCQEPSDRESFSRQVFQLLFGAGLFVPETRREAHTEMERSAKEMYQFVTSKDPVP